MKKKNRILLIEVIVFVLFLIFLISLIPDNNYEWEYSSSKTKVFGKNSDEFLQIKYDYLSSEVGLYFQNTKISRINNKVLSELIVGNKISNREHSIAQELVSLDNKNLTSDINNLSLSLIASLLYTYDTQDEIMWRNYRFQFVDDKNNSHVFFEETNVLTKLENASILGKYEFIARPYSHEKYLFTLENNTQVEVIVDLITYEGEEELTKFIDVNTRQPIVPIKKIDMEFIESDQEYRFQFFIWK